jgi:hypothetical protein
MDVLTETAASRQSRDASHVHSSDEVAAALCGVTL